MRRIGTILALALASWTALQAGQLDARLNRLKHQWAKDKASVVARVADTDSMMSMKATAFSRAAEPVVDATLLLSSTEVLERLGIPHTRITPTVVTAQVPVSLLEALEKEATVKHVAMAERMEPHNDLNMAKMNVAVPYAAGYSGSNVLVGIIDSGIDVSHPAFRVGGVSSGASRIKYLWDQSNATHTQFSVGSFTSTKGRRWTDAEITAGQCTETDTSGHGTHVAGSAAGYDAAFNTRNGGAKAANILFVKTTFSSTDITNAVLWLHEQAKQIGKPIVVNMSLGSKSGPHDGSDTASKAIDDLVAASNGNLIVVRSGGNYADDGHHDSATVTTAGVSLPVSVKAYTPNSNWDNLVFDFFYPATATISVRIKDSLGNTSAWLAPSATAQQGTMGDGSGFYVTSATAAEAYNPTIKKLYLELGELDLGDGKHVRDGDWTLEFKTDAGTAALHGWLWYTNNGLIPAEFAEPDFDTTLGNGACGNNILSVAAYVSRKSWQAADGGTYSYKSEVQDAIATFSSIGPTRDGRQKPDITTGGTQILSTRSAAMSPAPSAPYLPPDGSQFYTYMQGTSMASPTATGAVALLKEANPTWTYADMINYFRNNSQGTSIYAGQGTWSKNWGWGVLDLTKTVQPAILVAIDPAGEVKVLPGGTMAFSALVSNAASNTVSWSVTPGGGSVNPAVTAGDGVAQTTYTAPVTAGLYTLKATSTQDNTRFASVELHVYDPALVTVGVSPSRVVVGAGATQQFEATVAGAPNAGTVAWSATGGSINASGLYTAPSVVGTYTITATSNWGGTPGTATVYVRPSFDVNADGVVDAYDLLDFLKRFNSTTGADLAKADFNADGQIEDADLTLLLNAI